VKYSGSTTSFLLSSSPAFLISFPFGSADFLLVERDSHVAIASGVPKVSQNTFVISPAFAIDDSIFFSEDARSHFQSFSITRLNSGVVVTASKNASNHVSFLVIVLFVRYILHVRF
jgi:hypothetical protein